MKVNVFSSLLTLFCVTFCISNTYAGLQGLQDSTLYKTQIRLKELGFDAGPLSGFWDSRTEIAVKQYQTKNNLTPTGRLDIETLQKLGIDGIESELEVFVQVGHAARIYSVCFSPDSRYLATCSGDNTAKLWETATGKEIRTFTDGKADNIKDVAFSPDGQYLVTCNSFGESAILWDVVTGRELKRFRGHKEGLTSVTFSPDGKTLLTGSYDSTARIWDIASGRVIKTFSSTGQVLKAVFSPDGKWVLTGDSDRTAKLWDVLSGQKIRVFKGHSDRVPSVEFSPDGQYILTGSWDKTARLWKTSSRRSIRTFKGHSGMIDTVDFSPDGNHIITGGRDKTVKLWNVSTKKDVYTLNVNREHVERIAFSPDGKYIVAGEKDGCAKLWDAATGKEIRSFEGLSSMVRAITLSPDGQTLYSGSSDGYVRFLDLNTATVLRSLKAHISPIRSIDVSSNGKYLLTGSANQTARAWEIATGSEINTYSGLSKFNVQVAFSPDGQSFFAGGSDRTLRMLDFASGNELLRFHGVNGSISSVAVSPDGQYIIAGTYNSDGVSKMWNVDNGFMRQNPNGHWIEGTAFSPDGTTAATVGGSDNLVNLWDVSSFKVIKTFRGHTDNAYSVAYSPDGRKLASGSRDTTARVWDIDTGKTLSILRGHKNTIESIVFSRDGRFIATGCWDQTIKLWDAETGEELCQVVTFKNGEWIAMTPEGYYKASPKGDQYLNIRINPLQVVGIDQYRTAFYKPEMVDSRLKGLKPIEVAAETSPHIKKPATIKDMADYPPPMVVISSPMDGSQAESHTIDLQVAIKSLSPIKKIDVFVNGQSVLTPGERGIRIEEKILEKVIRKFSFPIQTGENSVLVRASNPYAYGEDRITVHGKGIASGSNPILPNLYLLSIGVSKYDHLNPRDQLAYASSDAKSFAELFNQMEGKIFRKVFKRLLTDDEAIQPTEDNIEDNLDFLRQAGQYDVAVLFLAGHGVRDERGKYYFLPKDAQKGHDDGFKKSSLIEWSALMDALDVPNARVLAFIDTCHAGSFFGKTNLRSIDNNTLIRDLIEQGTLVFAAATGNEFSQESEKWRHGAFTKAILDGLLLGKADLMKDNKITMKELDTFVSETVPRMTGGAQHPMTYSPEGYKDFPLWMLK